MRYSQSGIKTRRIADSSVTGRMIAAGIAEQTSAGSWMMLPLGALVLRRLETLVRNCMTRAGAVEVTLPVIQPADVWMRTGRWETYGDEMWRLSNRDGQKFCLAPTHEEMAARYAASRLTSWRDVPQTVFQIGSKFRDELRPRHGLVRAREFTMKDAYSFDLTEQGMRDSYDRMAGAYAELMSELGIEPVVLHADNGQMGGSFSQEILCLHPDGEERVAFDDTSGWRRSDDGQRALEIAHIFQLGQRFTEAAGAYAAGRDGERTLLWMGCYGIGLSRLISAMVHVHGDDDGCGWPAAVAPWTYAVLPATDDHAAQAGEVYNRMLRAGHRVMLDDRGLRLGRAIKDHKLIGVPETIIVGRDALAGWLEIETRDGGKRQARLDELT